ncbi:thiamine ABC transporter substrate-binding protein [Deinococcus aquiradiocola]|uniref:Thiamine ABC transporter substrate-binding protein n=1 Tax=Deinococcus aquiradiocola TaxID=393059 RepID=A0A917P3Y2_9DEIO|nr:thiamine ABC transporter substrate-binding protein [Deinococcus aquiradiocola]GGJ60438.1 thiamine ABC transporter substrate-binding protein [Deinococcus aquiradiocola]
MKKILSITLTLAATLSGTSTAQSAGTLTVITHDSFDVDRKLVTAFETANHVKVRFIKGGDAGEMLNKLILTKAAPLADAVYGLDNTLLPRAQAAGILAPYTSPAIAGVPAAYRQGPLLNTVDVGYVALNYDRAAFQKTGLKLPATLRELSEPQYARLTVVESPATSSTGAAFYLATVQELGQDGAVAWWRTARANGMKVTRGWSQAYNEDFSLYGGRYPIVLSYASSPAAEVAYSKEKLTASPTANLFLPGSTFVQLEGAAVLKGSRQPVLARKFVDFMLSGAVQADFPTRMWVYPAVGGVKLDPVWKFSQKPDVKLAPTSLLTRSQALTDLWVTQVLRK